jgi:PBSX family phage terminase large subunit
MIVGVSRESIQRNVISELCDLIGADIPSSKSTEVKILGRRVYLVGAHDEGAVRRIQGSTLAIAYVDEATCIPQPFWRMLLSRLSLAGAQLLATCNPEGPAHWLKKEFLDKSEQLNIQSWRFELDDNPVLGKDFKDSLKKE